MQDSKREFKLLQNFMCLRKLYFLSWYNQCITITHKKCLYPKNEWKYGH